MDSAPLHARLMENARRYDPAEHARGLLGPFQEALLLWRVKFMSYEQIAATLTSHGLKVSPAAVGLFCRRNFTKTQILRERQKLNVPLPRAPATPLPAPAVTSPAGRRGPKIARDDF